MLHFIFDFILKSQPSHPSPLMPFTKTTGPEGLHSLKASPWLLTPSLFIYTLPRTSQCIPDMASVTLDTETWDEQLCHKQKSRKADFRDGSISLAERHLLVSTIQGGGYIHTHLFPHSRRTEQVFSTGTASSQTPIWSLYTHATYFYYFIHGFK